MNLIQLISILPQSAKRAATFINPLNDSMEEFSINTLERRAAFIAQIGHESGQLNYVEEIASGADYEGRKDLGNTQPGDGVRYKGRGLIQITGRANYAAVTMALDIDVLDNPELLCTPENACRSAAWWWNNHGLNGLADKGNFTAITRRINGGLNGESNREYLWTQAKAVLGVSSPAAPT